MDDKYAPREANADDHAGHPDAPRYTRGQVMEHRRNGSTWTVDSDMWMADGYPHYWVVDEAGERLFWASVVLRGLLKADDEPPAPEPEFSLGQKLRDASGRVWTVLAVTPRPMKAAKYGLRPVVAGGPRFVVFDPEKDNGYTLVEE